jgi:hypothetical protein
MVAQARMKPANTSARQRRKVKELKEHGVPPIRRKRCFGYTKDYSAIIPAEAELRRDARDRLLSGASQRSICVEWQANGMTTTEGRAWQEHPRSRLAGTVTVACESALLDRQKGPLLWCGLEDASS